MSDAEDIIQFLRAMDEPQMADTVLNMHSRLEAFANGLDRDCRQVLVDRITELERQNAELQASHSQQNVIKEFLEAFEAEQLRVLQLDPRERAMQAHYSNTMGVMYWVHQFLREEYSPQLPTTAAPHQQSEKEGA